MPTADVDLPRGPDGQRPVFGGTARFQHDPAWDNLLFFEYFHGDNGAGLGASHQTGWTALIVDLLLDPPAAGRPWAGRCRGVELLGASSIQRELEAGRACVSQGDARILWLSFTSSRSERSIIVDRSVKRVASMALSAASNAVRAVEQAAIKITSMLRCLRRNVLGIDAPVLDERPKTQTCAPEDTSGARVIIVGDEPGDAVLLHHHVCGPVGDHLLDLDVFVPVREQKVVPRPAAPARFSSSVSESRSKHPLVEHSQINSYGAPGPSFEARTGCSR